MSWDEAEARAVLLSELQSYKQRKYTELMQLLSTPFVVERLGASGAEYQIEIEVMWDSREGENLLVMGSIDNGSFRTTLSPLCDSFIMAPDGTFIGE